MLVDLGYKWGASGDVSHPKKEARHTGDNLKEDFMLAIK